MKIFRSKEACWLTAVGKTAHVRQAIENGVKAIQQALILQIKN